MKSDKNHLTSLFVTMAGLFIVIHLIYNWTPDGYRNIGREGRGRWRGEREEREERGEREDRGDQRILNRAPNYYVNPWYYQVDDNSCDIESISTYVQSQKSKDFKSYVEYVKLICPGNKNMFKIDVYNELYDKTRTS
jgi:hypothetical protein